ncbi:hypothetical protein M1K46_22660 [Fictibacillus sp. WQ 8-8]|uniref:hypothetical protein n=1 Tax=Fictibacillus sp. WQ 8-8 TaxID=2938788 RepID=UPI00210CEBCB|nr:hypothetical protein [Fictibacillus sp. WQ 8-8]MCQ6268392.1 hypothetical protein [Fictibacillus sp. WQ 8-8]
MNKYLACLILSIAITACSNEEKKSNPKEREASTQESKAHKSQTAQLTNHERLDFGKRFDNFNFHPTLFKVQIKNNKLVLDMDYQLSGKLVNFLSKGIVYSYGIGFPDQTVEVTSLEQSTFKPGPSFSQGDSQRKFCHLRLVEDIPHRLTKKQINTLEKQIKGYSFVVLNKDNDTVFIMNDIYERSTIDPGNAIQEDLGKVKIKSLQGSMLAPQLDK